jgi:VCBS repeat-containing protein
MLMILQQMSLLIQLSDGTATDTATITITVTGVNDAPVAVNDTDAVNEDATVTQKFR